METKKRASSAAVHRKEKRVKAEEDKKPGELLHVHVQISCPCLYTDSHVHRSQSFLLLDADVIRPRGVHVKHTLMYQLQFARQ